MCLGGWQEKVSDDSGIVTFALSHVAPPERFRKTPGLQCMSESGLDLKVEISETGDSSFLSLWRFPLSPLVSYTGLPDQPLNAY